jgi:hypothetical protein
MGQGSAENGCPADCRDAYDNPQLHYVLPFRHSSPQCL